MPKELFLEIGTEEIPALFLTPSLEQLGKKTEEIFGKNRIEFSGLKTLGTPRRMVLWCQDVAAQQSDLEQEILGPAKRIAFDLQGKPTPAALGFAKAQGVAVACLSIKTMEKGEYLCVKKKEKGKKTGVLLKGLLPKLITSLSFPKSMRWNGGNVRFARPIRWMVSVYDDRLISFSVGGVRSGVYSRGHLAFSPLEKSEPVLFKFKGFKQYLREARKYHVIVDPLERREKIEKEIENLTRAGGSGVIPDEALLALTTNMVEFPVAIKGSFEREYLELPREVLINAMKEHQGFFPIEDSKRRLLPQFISVCDIKAPKMDIIRRGNERVLRARLADARFFFQKDRKEGLDKRVDELKGMTFQHGLGSLYEKTERLLGYGEFFANLWGLDPEKIRRACFLSKADLRTDMVGEFPKLQGIMGKEYAQFQGETEAVSQAISEQYLPGFVGDQLPLSEMGMALSVADKLDTLTGFFGLKGGPTGSQDPYGLRRQALGIVQILIGRKKRLSLVASITEGIRLYHGKLKRSSQALGEDLLDFLKQRVLYLLTQEGFRADFVSAILSRCEDPFDVRERVIALNGFSKKTGFNELIIAFTRVMNILPLNFEGEVQSDLFQEDIERDLYQVYQRVSNKVHPLMNEYRYGELLRELGSLKPFIDTFFDKVLVMDSDLRIRQNRLSLMKGLRDLFWLFGDFSRIQENEGKKG